MHEDNSQITMEVYELTPPPYCKAILLVSSSKSPANDVVVILCDGICVIDAPNANSFINACQPSQSLWQGHPESARVLLSSHYRKRWAGTKLYGHSEG